MATRKKITQKEAIFYQLYKRQQRGDHKFVPVFAFMGEMHCTELNLYGFVSHECSARSSQLRTENPDMIEYEVVTGKTGAKYYSYRLKPDFNAQMIADPKLLEFYSEINLL